MPFEKYVPSPKKEALPKARIRPSGVISFEPSTVEKYGIEEGSFAILFFDKVRKILAVQISDDGGDDGALRLSKRRQSMAVKAPDFFSAFNLVLEKPMIFAVNQHRNGNLLLDLKTVKRRRGRRKITA